MRKIMNAQRYGIILIVISIILFLLVFVVPWFSWTVKAKATIVTTLLVVAEVLWWIGVGLVGKQLWSKYKRALNPWRWFQRRK